MSSSSIILSVIKGMGTGNVYLFKESAECILGHAPNCDIQISSLPETENISRHHCMFIVNPPHARVIDLGSLNGTYVNGKLIGKRSSRGAADTALISHSMEQELWDGDEVRVGGTVFRVGVIAGSVKVEPLPNQSAFTFSCH